MSWTVPKTWTGSEVLTSSDMNAQCSGNVEYLYDNFALSNQWTNQGTSVSQENQRIESGRVWKAVTTSTYGSLAVTFNTAFGSTPRIMVSGGGEAVNYFAGRYNAGTGGFTAYATIYTGTYTGTYIIDWIAIGA